MVRLRRTMLRLRLHQTIAEAPDGLYELGRGRVVAELVAKALDVDVHGALVYVLVLAPDLAQQGVAREDASRAPGERVEQLELARREQNLLVALANLDLILVYLQIADVDLARRSAPDELALAEDLLHPRHQFPGVDRRAHVVVGPELYPDYAVHRVLVVQERNGRDAGLLDGGDYLEAPLVGQPVVHDGHLELLPVGHLARLRPRAGGDHTPPFP